MSPPRHLSSLAIAVLALHCGAQSSRPASPPTAPPENAAPRSDPAGQPPLTVTFRGRLPGSVTPDLAGTFRVEFRIYRSPTGGSPVWREAQDVEVVGGVMHVELGAVTPIPHAIHTATYKWLGAAVNGHREVYPRYPIVNVVYASPEEATARAAAAADRAEEEASPRPGPVLPDRAETPVSWEEALAQARAGGGDLPSYREWYADLERTDPDAAARRAGHYEWVLPWVYDSASHGSYNDLFRGRFQGCDYEDLSTQREYRYRIAPPTADVEDASR